MGEEALVEDLISDSIKLVEELDRGAFAPSFVVWYFYEDVDAWRLLIAGTEFDKVYPKKEHQAYQTISEAISSSDLQSLSISLVKLLETTDSLAIAIRSGFRTSSDAIGRIHWTDGTMNGIFVKEMIILRSASVHK